MPKHLDDKDGADVATLLAGDAFRATLLPRADHMKNGYYPMWHGWALMDAFIAGAAWARTNAEASQAVNPARIDTASLEDTATASAPSHVAPIYCKAVDIDGKETRCTSQCLECKRAAPSTTFSIYKGLCVSPGSCRVAGKCLGPCEKIEAAPSTTPQKTGETTRDRLVRDLVETKTPVPVATPRTDGAKFKAGDTDADLEVVTAEFSGQLERELAEVSDTLLWLNKQTTPSATARKPLPVTDDQPPIGESVLLWLVTENPWNSGWVQGTRSAYSEFNKEVFWDGNRYRPMAWISHWHPLPAAPERFERPNNSPDGGAQT